VEEVVGEQQVAFRLNSFSSHLVAAKSGTGIALLACFVGSASSLVPVLDFVPNLSLDVWLLVQHQAAKAAKVRLVKERLITVLKASEAL
jgi:DNA-binding transcriptional LysR family regulator